MLVTLGLAGIAGLLSTLSPCVLPLLPIVLASAVGQHRLGPAALAGGLALSFAAVGIFVATIGFAAGIGSDVFRYAAAILLVAIGLTLLFEGLQARFALLAGPAGNFLEARFGASVGAGLSGQFGLGFLLGVVWLPCVGPTLGAASILAARGESLASVAMTMLAFGVGAALPLVALGMISRATLLRWRDRLTSASGYAKHAMGAMLVALGGVILSGYDKRLEAYLVEISPAWLTELTTRF